jgi:uncharacterized membrane protein YeaQ/YmgE (transglycosylase-associated protein family)
LRAVIRSGDRSDRALRGAAYTTPYSKEEKVLGLIISLIVIGLIAGALARLIVPGKQDLSIAMTTAIGIVGSFVGGFLGYVIFHKDGQNGFFQPSGIVGSVIGAVIVLLLWQRIGGRSTIRPQHRQGRA